MKRNYLLIIALLCFAELFSQSAKTDAMLSTRYRQRNSKHLSYVTIMVKIQPSLLLLTERGTLNWYTARWETNNYSSNSGL